VRPSRWRRKEVLFASYLDADWELRELYADSIARVRNVILNVVSSGRFSSDRTIAEYAREIWEAKPCPIP
jgi:starch phosphorylase